MATRTSAKRRKSALDTDHATIAQCLWERAAGNPDEILYRFQDEEALSIGVLADDVRSLAASLFRLGLVQGDAIGFQLTNCRAAIVINAAAAALGLTVVPIPPRYRSHEISFILRDAKVQLLFAGPQSAALRFLPPLLSKPSDMPELRHVFTVECSDTAFPAYEDLLAAGRGKTVTCPTIAADDRKVILYTAGTSGRAKGVIHSHRSAAHSAVSSVVPWSITSMDVMLAGSSVAHVTGYMCGLELALRGNLSMVMLREWDAAIAVDTIEALEVTCTVGSTPLLSSLLDEAERRGAHLPSLRFYACGGVAIPPSLIYRASRLTAGCRAFRVYGATEVPMATKGFLGPDELALAAETDGRIVNYDVRVILPDGTDALIARPGEILLRGPGMMIGYTDAEETRAAVDEDGFYHTGDIGYLTADDAVVVTGRSRDLIVRAGEKLSPKEIEEALERHPAIAAAAIVAMPHPSLGEVPCAFLETSDGAAALGLHEIAAYLRHQGLVPEKFPERIEYVSRLPRTASGKLRKEPLRRAIAAPIALHYSDQFS